MAVLSQDQNPERCDGSRCQFLGSGDWWGAGDDKRCSVPARQPRGLQGLVLIPVPLVSDRILRSDVLVALISLSRPEVP